MAKSKKAAREFLARRAARVARLGIEMEDRVEQILARMQEDGLISSFRRNPHFSPADLRGEDFTVTMVMEDGKERSRSFGVTVSCRSAIRANTMHPRLPTWWFPVEIKDETIMRRIVQVFHDPRFAPEGE